MLTVPDTHTRLYCIFGSPVSHSKSPLIHNQAFSDKGINAVYLAFEPDDIGQALESMRTLNVSGASVTIPFKAPVMDHLDWIDPEALEIGAVNTIVNQDGQLRGYNTDSRAAVDPLKPYGIENKKVLVIGAGGAARAVAFGIAKNNGHLFITNRTLEKGRALAAAFKGHFLDQSKILDLDPDIVINTTSLGMTPHTDVTPFPVSGLKSSMVVMDVVYTPFNTRLIESARERGCQVIDGLSMFLAQGAAQFELWTRERPDLEKMRQVLLNSFI